MALGSLLIQQQFRYADEELVEQIRENPYYQYFIGLPGYVDAIPFVPSLLVEFRKRLSADIMIEINATEEAFCLSFQTVRKDRKYLDEFLKNLDEEGITYKVGAVEERKLPEIVLPG